MQRNKLKYFTHLISSLVGPSRNRFYHIWHLKYLEDHHYFPITSKGPQRLGIFF